jgi:sirohydrochlorin ferrochelatase
MRAVILVGHGSLRPGSGAAMIRLAARARAAGIAPLVAVGFLNYSRPLLGEALARCIARGASEVALLPYFLVPGRFVRADLPRALEDLRQQHSAIPLTLARCFEDHLALERLVLKRAEALSTAPAPRQAREPLVEGQHSALLIMAHGSPDPAANRPIEAIAERIRAGGSYAQVALSYMDLNRPRIGEAIDALVGQGLRRLVALPYFLQLGGHVAEDLPAIIAVARARHPTTMIDLAEHLAYDPLLLEVIADRAREALSTER